MKSHIDFEQFYNEKLLPDLQQVEDRRPTTNLEYLTAPKLLTLAVVSVVSFILAGGNLAFVLLLVAIWGAVLISMQGNSIQLALPFATMLIALLGIGFFIILHPIIFMAATVVTAVVSLLADGLLPKDLLPKDLLPKDLLPKDKTEPILERAREIVAKFKLTLNDSLPIEHEMSWYTRTYRVRVITKILTTFEPSLTLVPDWFIPQSEFEASGLFRSKIVHYHGSALMEWKSGGTQLRLSLFNCKRVTNVESGLNGIYCIADGGKANSITGEIYILPEKEEKLVGQYVSHAVQSRNINRPPLVKLENPVFESQFVVYSTDQVEARYILSVDVMERLVQLQETLNGRVWLSYKNGKAFLVMETPHEFFRPVHDRAATSKAQVEEFFDEAGFLFATLEQLNITSS